MGKTGGGNSLQDLGARMRTLTLRSRYRELKEHYPWSLSKITKKRLEKDAAAPGGTVKLREACWRRGIDVSSRSWSKTCIEKLMAWKAEFKKTHLPAEPESYATNDSEEEGSTDAEFARARTMYLKYAPWNLDKVGEDKLKKVGETYGKKALQGMCHKRRILVNDNSSEAVCIQALLKWKKDKGYEKFKPLSEKLEEMHINDWDKLSREKKKEYSKDVGKAHTDALDAWIWLNLKPVSKRREYRTHMKAMWGERLVTSNMDVDHIFPRKQGGADHPKNYQLLPREMNVLKCDKDPLLFATLSGVDITVQTIEASMMSGKSLFNIQEFENARCYAESLVQKGHKKLMETIFEPNGVHLGEKVKVPFVDVSKPLIKVPTCGEILDAWQNISQASMENSHDEDWVSNGENSEEEFLKYYSILNHRNYDPRYFQVVYLVPLNIGGARHADNCVPIAKHAHYERGNRRVFVQEREFTIFTDEKYGHGTCPFITALFDKERIVEACELCEKLCNFPVVDGDTAWFIKKNLTRAKHIAANIWEQGKIDLKNFENGIIPTKQHISMKENKHNLMSSQEGADKPDFVAARAQLESTRDAPNSNLKNDHNSQGQSNAQDLREDSTRTLSTNSPTDAPSATLDKQSSGKNPLTSFLGGICGGSASARVDADI